ncbi:DISARM system phospholipase D-like protein DrmC [Streptomyces sp. GESEQ-35]|uniref:DISARM system phospholipase D-like protein DrmC n=1 Tax=Streptomyces sp. GESEQ-35 TaxID=2812657 RepID=UPI0027E25C6C|nr:DISARM system phospholipase D-like protein DrmC [Streptomyces sp. GESEQ-35]
MGADGVRTLAEGIGKQRPRASVLSARAFPGFADAATALLEAIEADGVASSAAAAYLHGLAAGHALRAKEQEISLVWSGPSSHRVPVRTTSRALLQLVEAAQQELLLMTYSATRYTPLTNALDAAVGRGVHIDVVVETLQGAGSALSGTEPASAFLEVPGLRVWHWPLGNRAEPGAKTHAKLALADRRVLLTTSANFTQSGVDRNIEAGVLITGGSVPARTSEHIQELQRTGVLQRYW